MIYIDASYVNRAGSYLEGFAKKKQYLWNCRCPVCGDLSKGKVKKRFYFYRPDNKPYISAKCHHCGYSANVGTFLKTYFPEIYKEYALERYKATAIKTVPHKTPVLAITPKAYPTELIDAALEGLKHCKALPDDHPVSRYLNKRMIPREQWEHIYFTRAFKKYTNGLIPGKFKDEEDDHPRLVIPYFDAHGKMFAYIGRAFGKEEPKYYTIKLDDRDRVFGLDRIDPKEKIYAVEGPIDSLFLPNGIAVSGSSFDTPTLQSLKSRLVIVHDNEPRSREITKIIKKNIELGYAVSLFPHTIKEKDINEMIQAGYTSSEILDIIDRHTVRGAEAMLMFAHWKLC